MDIKNRSCQNCAFFHCCLMWNYTFHPCKDWKAKEEREKTLDDNNARHDLLYGYRIEDLARVAILIEKCDVKPEDIRRLSDNLIMLYGVVMRGIKNEIKASSERVLIECRYPGYADVLRMIEEEKNEKRK